MASEAKKKAAVVFIFITVLLDILALGIIIPVLPKLIFQFTSGKTGDAAEIYGIVGTLWAFMHFLFSPLLGSLSDRFGRKPIILLSNFSLGFDYILMALAPSLGWLMVGRAVSGIAAASIPTANAYIADVTPPEKRAAGFGMLGAAFGIGFVLGPALGGILGSYDPRLPFWVAALMSLLNGCYGMIILPESLAPENRSTFSWKRANPLGSLKFLRKHRNLFGYSLLYFINSLAHVVLPSTFVLYATYRYGWNEKEIGGVLALVGICAIIVQGGCVQFAVNKLGESKMLKLGFLFGAIGFTCFGLAPTGLLFSLAMPFTALWGLAGAGIQGLMTQSVQANEQGELQGANSSIMGIAELIGPMIFTLTFSAFIAPEMQWHLPGAPYLLAAGLLLCGFCYSFVLKEHQNP